ncbi:MAG TPA: transglutaminaseTgpA domain-containing protein [Actinomycetota bacterium]|nr:transglutaminaseTgpA domain-containing protein [Actinomycetota bacterium]
MAALIARLRRTTPPTDAIPFRVAVCLTVVVSVGAALGQQAVPTMSAVVALVAVPGGFVLSYKRRGHRNVLLKLGLAAGLFAAFANFLSDVQGAISVDETRMPLAELFVWVQVLHSLDVPRRRDLGFSLASSVSLMALAGSVSISTGFLPYAVAFGAAFAAALALRHLAQLHERASAATDLGEPSREEAVEVTRVSARPPGRSILRPAAAVAGVVLAFTGLAFVALPRFPGIQVATLPVQLANNTPISRFTGSVVNPGRQGQPEASRGGGFAPDAYFGYGDGLDLRTRGRLSEEMVFRVRAPEPALWRGQVYDRYDDGYWSSTGEEETVTARSGFDRSILVPRPPGEGPRFHGSTRELVQTFYVERPLPNLVFHAAEARELFIPSTSVEVDPFSSVRLPFLLEEDTIYSVISRISTAGPDDLRLAAAPDTSDPALARYLTTPDSLSPRVAHLARTLTADAPTTYDKAEAVESWLRRTKAYRLDIPRDPPGVDPLEVFLFERHEGFCEQIATAMAVLLREAGVPTRLVAGYGAGERNPFTGYWEVRNSDAHAWVEVLYPGYGWIPYDPTFGVPEARATNTRFMLEPLLTFARRLLPVRALAWAMERLGGALASAAVVLVLVLAAASVLTVLRRRTRTRSADTPTHRVVSAWMRVEEALAREGCARGSSETPLAFCRRACTVAEVEPERLRAFGDLFVSLRYGRDTPAPEDILRLEHMADTLVGEVRASRPSAFATARR